jgi:hydrogenase maturation protein HypF
VSDAIRSVVGEQRERLELRLGGAVQGLGFRPFVYRVARELGLCGRVLNSPEGVEICVEGARGELEAFRQRVTGDAPPLCVIESVEESWGAARGEAGFSIDASAGVGEALALVLPDIAVCDECMREVLDASNRRHRYPFTNCTHCGPRFSIVNRLPYDRCNTSMASFQMCGACRAEYEDPEDRRFHAQPIACPACGPKLALWRCDGSTLCAEDEALLATAQALRDGRVVAVKGLGGFHLMADARDEEVVARLRGAKRREEKPFALMYPDLESIEGDCEVSECEARLLTSPESPIVLLRRRKTAGIGENVAAEVPTLGAMLPYTPLHRLLMGELGFPVVATSGNLREEPICIDEHEALGRLAGIAELFLVHDRPIVRPVDDSIARVMSGEAMLLRRARGYAPLPIRVKESGAAILAVGGHLKNTVAVGKGRNVFLSQHVGDLDTPMAVEAFARAAGALETLYEVEPERVVHDLHPDYQSTTFARSSGLPALGVQHHFAHVLACMAEHDLDGPVLGVAWDGSGYGADGTVWGGEFLEAYRDRFRRVGHLRAFRLPGGEKAVTEPRRSALAVMVAALGAGEALAPEWLHRWHLKVREAVLLCTMVERGFNAPLTTSAGRLFDAVASLTGLRQVSSYEGQAAMALEAAAMAYDEGARKRYALPLVEEGDTVVLDWRETVRAIVRDLRGGAAPGAVAAGFHDALAQGIADVARRMGIADVVLTGGCFQNAVLSDGAKVLLEAGGFRVWRHRRVPANDGGIALGQAVYGLVRCRE